VKLYWHPMSQPSRTAYAVSRHMGLPVETVLVDLAKGEQRTPEHLARNPNGKVPVLEDEGFLLWESSAIMIYLAEKVGDHLIWPDELQDRADVLRWMTWASPTWNRPLGVYSFQRFAKPALGLGDPDEAALEQAGKDLALAAKVLEAHLEGRSWVCLGRITLADFALASMLTHAGPAGIDLGPSPNIRRWYAGMNELPAWEETDPHREPPSTGA